MEDVFSCQKILKAASLFLHENLPVSAPAHNNKVVLLLVVNIPSITYV